MKATIRSFFSTDISNLATYQPDEDDNFGFLLQLMVGPTEGKGEESFDVEVCTPNWLAHTYAKSDLVIGRHHLIVFSYDYERIRSFLTSYVEKCEGASWREVAMKVSRLGKWEFEDYRP